MAVNIDKSFIENLEGLIAQKDDKTLLAEARRDQAGATAVRLASVVVERDLSSVEERRADPSATLPPTTTRDRSNALQIDPAARPTRSQVRCMI